MVVAATAFFGSSRERKTSDFEAACLPDPIKTRCRTLWRLPRGMHTVLCDKRLVNFARSLGVEKNEVFCQILCWIACKIYRLHSTHQVLFTSNGAISQKVTPWFLGEIRKLNFEA